MGSLAQAPWAYVSRARTATSRNLARKWESQALSMLFGEFASLCWIHKWTHSCGVEWRGERMARREVAWRLKPLKTLITTLKIETNQQIDNFVYRILGPIDTVFGPFWTGLCGTWTGLCGTACHGLKRVDGLPQIENDCHGLTTCDGLVNRRFNQPINQSINQSINE